jgi:hypothetical protein
MENGEVTNKINFQKVLKYIFSMLLLCSNLSFTETSNPNKTWYGDPNLQGIWTNATLTTLERPKHFKTLEVNEEEARSAANKASADTFAYDNQYLKGETPKAGRDVGGYNTAWMDPGEELFQLFGKYRTSIIAYPKNGKVPWDREKANKFFQQRRKDRSKRRDHPELRGVGERCVVGFGSSGGPPMMNVLYNNHYQIVQSPGYVMIMAEMVHDARIIRLDGKHPTESISHWLGDSIGHWDGNTLVVETTNFNPQHTFRAGLRHFFAITPGAIVTERFTRISKDQILYRFYVDDPDIYSQVWAGEMPLRSVEDKIYEYACHEGNYSMANILAGAREEEKRR